MTDHISEYLRVAYRAIRAGLGLGPRRDMSAEARLRRVIDASRPRIEESIRRGEQELHEGKWTTLDDLK